MNFRFVYYVFLICIYTGGDSIRIEWCAEGISHGRIVHLVLWVEWVHFCVGKLHHFC